MGVDGPYLYLTTIGRSSGLEREIEIWFVELDGCFYLISEKRDRAHWVRNIAKEPRIRVRVEERRFDGTGRALAEDDEADRPLIDRVQAMFDEKYGWSTGLVVELRPDRG